MNLNQLIIFLGFIFGACIGSFLNVVIWRMPREEAITGRSHCPNCRKVLGPKELVPVLSFILLKGKCHNCKNKISYRYPILEFLCGLVFVFTLSFYSSGQNIPWLLVVKVLFGLSVLLAIFVIDLEHFLILDNIVFFSSAVVFCLNLVLDFQSKQSLFLLSSQAFGGLVAGICAALPFFAIWFFSKGKWMGFGDVKLMLFLGLFLGWPLIWVSLFLAVILGGFVSILLMLFLGKDMKTKLPFGTFLAFSAAFSVFYGVMLLKWYLGFLGL